MWRCVGLGGLLGAFVLAWSGLGRCIPSGSERAYLLIGPAVVVFTACLTAGGWRSLREKAPAALAYFAALFVAMAAYNLYQAALMLPTGPAGWVRALAVAEIFIAAYFIASVRLFLDIPLTVLRRPLHGAFAYVIPPGRWKAILRETVPELLLVPLILPYILGTLYVHRFKIPNGVSPLAFAGRSYEDVTFTTEDGLTLRGWFIPAPSGSSSRCLLICHGLGANRSNFLAYLPVGDALRANVLMFDFRGHGESDGHTISFGALEERDVRAAVDYLRVQRPAESRELIGLGISMGSSGLIGAAAKVTPPLHAVVVDSAFARAVELTDQVLAKFPAFTRPLISGPGVLFASLETGCWLPAVRPEEWVAGLRCPVLVIHAEADELIPAEHARRLHRRAADPKGLWVTRTGGHGSALSAGVEYQQRITEFVDGHRAAR